MVSALHSAVYEGWVRHRRMVPVSHQFGYRMFQLYLDLDELPNLFNGRWLWSWNRPNLAQVRRRDCFGDTALSIADAVRNRVLAETGARPSGPIRMLTHGRYFGVSMNPVTFYYGFEPDGVTLSWLLAEITNTPWGERHAYFLDVSDATSSAGILRWDIPKRFHVSPFIPMERDYRWAFTAPSERLLVHMDVMRGPTREMDATLALTRRPLNANTLASSLARYPWLTAKVAAAIYWQAARLKLKGVPFHPHPPTQGHDKSR